MAGQKGLPGRLSKGAGTHLASWLQESRALSTEEAQALLDSGESRAQSTQRGERALAGWRSAHGRCAGHAKPITDVAHSGDLLVSKDPTSMRLWRAQGDFALLRVIGGCKGKHVAIHHTGQFIVTGTRTPVAGAAATAAAAATADVAAAAAAAAKARKPKVWGPAGGSAFSAGKKTHTTGLR